MSQKLCSFFLLLLLLFVLQNSSTTILLLLIVRPAFSIFFFKNNIFLFLSLHSLWRVGSGVVWHCGPEGPGLVRLLLVPPQGGRVRQGEHHRQQLQQRQRRPRRREAQQDGDDLVLQLAPDRRQAAVDVDAAVDGDVALGEEVAAAARARLQAARVRHRVLVPADVGVAPDLGKKQEHILFKDLRR